MLGKKIKTLPQFATLSITKIDICVHKGSNFWGKNVNFKWITRLSNRSSDLSVSQDYDINELFLFLSHLNIPKYETLLIVVLKIMICKTSIKQVAYVSLPTVSILKTFVFL